MQAQIKTIGSSGQLSLGTQVIPDDELWLHTPELRASLDRALEWSALHARSETDTETNTRKIRRKR